MRFVPTAFLLFSAHLIACAAPSTDSLVSSEAELAAPTAACDNHQIVPDATPAQRQSVLREFAAANGPGWNERDATWMYGSVVSVVTREGTPFGVAKDVTANDATEIARALVTRSYKTLGIRSLATVKFEADDSFAYPRVPWVVSLEIPEQCQAEFAGVEGACQRLFGAVFVRDDGTVHLVHMYGGNSIPVLTMNPRPALPASTAAEGLVGQRLTRVRGPFENGAGTLVDYGTVAPEDIVAETSRSIVITRPEEGKGGELSLKLAHVVTVRRGDADGIFELDTCSGEILTKSVWGP
jgi:hypothetical protein